MSEFERSELSFEQAEGAEALPTPMALKHVSAVLRARLWDVMLLRVETEMKELNWQRSLGRKWAGAFRDFCVKKLAMLSDTVGTAKSNFIETMRPRFQKDDYIKVLGTVEWFVRNCADDHLKIAVRAVLEEERCAYRLVETSIIPVASPEEGEAFMGALDALTKPSLGGARSHLLKAGSLLTSGDFAGSVRESIHSVESTARSLTGEGSLLKALQEISKKHPMHPALKNGFNSIYGYTSDANGIRHPIVGDDGPLVGEAEAIFMLGACASFVTYLSRAAQ
ncbi:hypothetical protein N2601_17860 [Rhizobium sp. CB3060]|uniref:hypothetical protein n=1 Tax=Rhizobium sp. CB3060 TaxID=3138255 RepID=UPI0021A3E7F6|nr:hypothetical protein [Rhizobium tropici]UWU21090.1 hypothetical protein N2601_17860 [Rhizobium tropici]